MLNLSLHNNTHFTYLKRSSKINYVATSGKCPIKSNALIVCKDSVLVYPYICRYTSTSMIISSITDDC